MQNSLSLKNQLIKYYSSLEIKPQTQNSFQVKIVLHITSQTRQFSSNYWQDLMLVVTAEGNRFLGWWSHINHHKYFTRNSKQELLSVVNFTIRLFQSNQGCKTCQSI